MQEKNMGHICPIGRSGVKWLDKVKHVGNFINTDCNEITDCNFLKNLCLLVMLTSWEAILESCSLRS